jgi:hypothetical protein
MSVIKISNILSKFNMPCKYGISSSDVSLAAQEISAELVEWKDVEDFIKWYILDEHNFDILYDEDGGIDGFINVKTDKSYTHRELFDYWIKYVKQ